MSASAGPQSTQAIAPAQGKLGVMIPGMGAVATTLIAGVEAVRRGLAQPVGSLTQMDTLKLGETAVPVKEAVPLAALDDLVFTGWDIFGGNLYDAARTAQVLDPWQLEAIKPYLESIEPMPAVFDQHYVKRLTGKTVKQGRNKCDLANQIRNDISAFKQRTDRQVMLWCGSTEIFLRETEVHQTLAAFERGMVDDDPNISPSMLYAWAALKEGVPFANGAPNLTADIPALRELSKQTGAPICGKDFKTGQTFIKTVLAPALKARSLGLNGWYSTNILGNRDGEVLDDPESFKTKEESKLGVLEYILEPEKHPELYRDIFHKVRINYYPPRGDNKEGWDSIDLFGWLGYPMQIKVDFLCRDSILAAPLALDLCLFLDLAQRTPSLKHMGVQEWLSFYFKAPDVEAGSRPEHDLFLQAVKLKNTLKQILADPAAPVTNEELEYATV
ncbi:inositol-3-phosphate synthase [Terriglobus sp.]|uniref:inositol-3-phosphate synthase n=1 Tax=Terriglobus sp. TaxID=1889013 RepID=UPI003B00DD07